MKGSCQPLGLYCYDLDLTAAERELSGLNEHGMPATHSSCPGGACSSSNISSGKSLLSPAVAGDVGSLSQQDGGGNSSSNTTMNAVGRVRHSLAVLPDAASAARSSVVVLAGHASRGQEDRGSGGVDPAEVSQGGAFYSLWLALVRFSLLDSGSGWVLAPQHGRNNQQSCMSQCPL